MNIDFTFKNFDPSEHLKKYARRRFEKVGRFLGRAPALTMHVVLSVDKFRQKVEVQLKGEGLNVNAAEHSSDMYATIDLVTDKLESQVRKVANKYQENRRKIRDEINIDIYTYELQDEDGVTVVYGTENFVPKPLHIDEAIMQFEQSDNEVLVFINAEMERINVIYRKKNGEFGIIDPIV